MNPTRTSPWVVETEGLTKRFGDRLAVDRVDLRIPAGSAFGYLGPNGAGKTTLIRMLLGLTPATAGSMRLLGLPMPKERATALARVGAIVEEPRSHPFLTGRENLAIVAAARERAAHARIDGALARVGLADRGNDRVKTYSLGMRQRLGVARCLLADPALLDGQVVESVQDGLRVRANDAASINRRLVEAGIDVYRLEPERISLERRFLEITSRLEVAA